MLNTNPAGQRLNTVLRIEIDGQTAGEVDDGLLRITGGAATVRGSLSTESTASGCNSKRRAATNRRRFSGLRRERHAGAAVRARGRRIHDHHAGRIASSSADNVIGGETPARRNLLSDVSDRRFVSCDNRLRPQRRLGQCHWLQRRGRTISPNRGGGRCSIAARRRGNTESAAHLPGLDATSIAGNTIGDGVTLKGSNNCGDRQYDHPELERRASSNRWRGHRDFAEFDICQLRSSASTCPAPLEMLSINLPQDDDDPDTGPNNLQNFPAITSVVATAGATTVNGVLSSPPSSTYRLEFFASDATATQPVSARARIYLGSLDRTTDASGDANFLGELAGGAGRLQLTFPPPRPTSPFVRRPRRPRTTRPNSPGRFRSRDAA